MNKPHAEKNRGIVLEAFDTLFQDEATETEPKSRRPMFGNAFAPTSQQVSE